MKMLLEQVSAFMEAADQPIGKKPGVARSKDVRLGMALIEEEVAELRDALAYRVSDRLPEIADAVGDILYVTTWLALTLGLPMEEIMEEIQRANMAKFGPGARKDPVTGKQLKPSDWQPPDVVSILQRHLNSWKRY